MPTKLQIELLNDGTGRVTVSGYTRYLHIAPQNPDTYEDPSSDLFVITSDDHLKGKQETLDEVHGFAAAIVAAVSLMIHLAGKDGIDVNGFPDSLDWP